MFYAVIKYNLENAEYEGAFGPFYNRAKAEAWVDSQDIIPDTSYEIWPLQDPH